MARFRGAVHSRSGSVDRRKKPGARLVDERERLAIIGFVRLHRLVGDGDGSRSSSGSRKIVHHWPLGSLGLGVAIFQPLISLYCDETIAAGSTKLGPTGAQAETERAEASDAVSPREASLARPALAAFSNTIYPLCDQAPSTIGIDLPNPAVLGRVQWLKPSLKVQDRQVKIRKSEAPIQTNLAGVIYERLYRARNDFVHGNPITDETLRVEKRRKHVHWFAASLFRLALTGFLSLGSRRRCWTRRTTKTGSVTT